MKKLFKLIGKTILYIIGFLFLAFVVFYMATIGEHKVAETLEHNDTISYITFDDISLHIETFGNDSNEVIIVVHGGPGNDSKYLLDLQDLADKYFVVFYDQRGSGLSPRVTEDKLSLDAYLSDLNNIINHFGQGKKVNLIGHSWGAMLSSAYICKYPNKINKVVLAEPGWLNPEVAKKYPETTKNMSIHLNFQVLKHLAQTWFQSLHVKKVDDQARFDYFMENFIMTDEIDDNPISEYFANDELTPGSFPSWRFGAMASTVIPSKTTDKDGNPTVNYVDGIENFTNEVLFLAGECNHMFSSQLQRENVKLFPNAKLVTVANAGHYMITEQPEVCNQIIRSYFSE